VARLRAMLDPDGWQEQVAALRVLARERLVPVAAAGAPGRVDRALVAVLAETGLSQRLFPADLGGSAGEQVSSTELCLIREALAAECPTAETTLAVQGLGSYPILQAGRPEVVRRWIPSVAAGRAVAAFALTEPDAGSDAAALSLAAERDGDGYRLTGEKRWISHAPDADVYTVFARTTPDAGARGVTAFAVPGDAAGLSGEPLSLSAPHAIGALTFDGVCVGADEVLGEVDAGFRVAMDTLDRFRPSVGAAAVGMAQSAFEVAVAHAGARQAFGRPLREFQAVSHRLADMATSIAAARLLVRDAAAARDAGRRTTKQAAMAKLFATEMAQQVVDGAIQVHGAGGLERGTHLEALYREVRALRIYEGTSEIQRTIIAREVYREREAGT
jgi:acyl-CoA dehydrogenase